MLNLKYSTHFVKKCSLAIFLLCSYFTYAHKTLILIAAIFYSLRAVSFGITNYKEKRWHLTYRKHDQRTRANAYYAGYIAMWFMIIIFFFGTMFVEHFSLPIGDAEYFAYMITAPLVLMWIIRDYLNKIE